MANIAPIGKSYYYDDNGEPLNGGKVFTYEVGTTTPKVTFTTQDESTANANPVILDADGGADIWLGDGGYKFVVTDSADVELFTTDNLGGGSTAAFGGNVNTLTSNTPITDLFANSVNICTSAVTLTLLAASTAAEGFYFTVQNNSGGNVVVDPDGAETINGASTYTFGDDESGIVICNGTTWFVVLADSSILPLNNTFTGDNIFQGDSQFTGSLSATSETPVKEDKILIADISDSDNAKETTLLNAVSSTLLDEDDMDSNSDTQAPTQQSVVSYIGNVAPTDSIVKGWAVFDMTGTIVDSYNVDSVTDNGAADFIINWTTDFANTNYCVSGDVLADNDTTIRNLTVRDKAVGTTRVIVGGTTKGEGNITQAMVIAIGEQ